jgi:hypothetical protein
MTVPTSDLSAELRCHRCEYDLRAHAQGKCPECGTSVAESRKWAAIPRRPVWRNSDPRWRRRMIAGTWVLTLLPLMSFLRWLEMDSKLTVPNIFRLPGPFTLRESFLTLVYEQLVFCVGVVLLFSKERGRRGGRLEWTRRWGVLCSYIVLLLCAMCALFVPALVLLGIGALFLSMPPKFAPPATGFIVETSAAYLRYGPYPRPITLGVLVAFSSITILLACAPLYEALCSCGLKRIAVVLLAPWRSFRCSTPCTSLCIGLGAVQNPTWDRASISSRQY